MKKKDSNLNKHAPDIAELENKIYTVDLLSKEINNLKKNKN